MDGPVTRRYLDTRPVRPLTSRELASVLGGLLGGVLEWCEPDAVAAALRFYAPDGEAFPVLVQVVRAGRNGP